MSSLPNLDTWLEGAGPEHPVRVEMAFGGMDDWLNDLERSLPVAAISGLQGQCEGSRFTLATLQVPADEVTGGD